MKKILMVLAVVAVLVAGCSWLPELVHRVDLSVSLGPFSSYPGDPEYSVEEASDLIKYGGKPVVFSVVGLDAGNNSVNLQGIEEFGWTGGDQSSSTQFASYTFDLGFGRRYSAGRYEFRIYIDWNGNSTLDSGDLAFESYTIFADKDGDPETQALIVAESEYGSSIAYDPATYTITIEDPLSADSGLGWVITSIGEGPLVVVP
jgi:hypothetical protein